MTRTTKLPQATLRLLPLFLLALTGCFSVRTHAVKKTVLAEKVLNASLDELLQKTLSSYQAIQTINATVEITATTGGTHQGEVKEIPTFAGYIFLRKPSDLRVLLLVPVLRSRALDMVSDGKTFKLLIPPKNRAITGSDSVTTPSPKGFENLRPSIIRESLQVPPIAPGEFVDLAQSSRILTSETKKHEAIEEPDYDLTVFRLKSGHVLERVRVVHIGRTTLEPYEQDIYDSAGRVVTIIHYERYGVFNGVRMATLIDIRRPLDEYTLKIDISKVVLNAPLDDEQFALTFPEGIPVTTM